MHPAGAVRGHAARCLLLHPFFLRRRLIFSLLALATHVDITHVTTHPVQQADSCKLSPWSLVVFSLLPFAVGSRSKRTAAARPARSVLAPPHPSQQAARERKSKGAGAEREEKSPKVLGWYFSVVALFRNGDSAMPRCGMVFWRSPPIIMVDFQKAQRCSSRLGPGRWRSLGAMAAVAELSRLRRSVSPRFPLLLVESVYSSRRSSRLLLPDP